MRTLLIALLLIASAASVRADRDIVFAADFYRWSGQYIKHSDGTREQTLTSKTGQHLFRINPGGGRLRQITRGAGSESDPQWSQDGRSIFFLKWVQSSCGLWSCDENGAHSRQLTPLPKGAESIRYAPSPDGSRIAICYVVWDFRRRYGADERILLLVTPQGKRLRKIVGVHDFAWSPDGRILTLVRAVDRKRYTSLLDPHTGRERRTEVTVLNAVWIDNDHWMGDAPPPERKEDAPARIVFLTRRGKIKDTKRLTPFSPSEAMIDDSIWGYGRVRDWRPLNRRRTRWVMENFHGMSDGAHHVTYLVDTVLRRYRELGGFSLVAVEPTGKRILAAEHEWIGPYKRGGERCGALEVVSLPSGKRKELTTKLVSIYGGDWRRTRK